ncbi:YxiG-like protein [Streptomyces luteolus]
MGDSGVRRDPCQASPDDRLTDHKSAADLDGYVWGVNCHSLYPGARLLPESEVTRRWSQALGIDFHEVCIETDAHRITLLFSQLQVTEVPVGYAPFVTDQRPAKIGETGLAA